MVAPHSGRSLLAQGREAEVFDLGDGTVLKRYRAASASPGADREARVLEALERASGRPSGSLRALTTRAIPDPFPSVKIAARAPPTAPRRRSTKCPPGDQTATDGHAQR